MRLPLLLFAAGLAGFVAILGAALACVDGDIPISADAESSTAPAASEKTLRFDLGDGVEIELVWIEPGEFVMGSSHGDAEERPPHKVTISKPFYLGKFEVTQEQWKAVMGTDRGRIKGTGNPVDSVSWQDAQAFVQKLNEKLAGAGVTFGLPSEAQWEYACRARTTTAFGFGDEEAALGEHAWIEGNAGGRTHPVGQKKPNAWGLFDMHGNVWEWCADWYAEDYYEKSPADDPAGPEAGSARVLRGGSWSDGAAYCRASYRFCLPPWFCVQCYGFRVACSPGTNRP